MESTFMGIIFFNDLMLYKSVFEKILILKCWVINGNTTVIIIIHQPFKVHCYTHIVAIVKKSSILPPFFSYLQALFF